MSLPFHDKIRIGAFHPTVAMTRSIGWNGCPGEEPPSGDTVGDSAGIGIVELASRDLAGDSFMGALHSPSTTSYRNPIIRRLSLILIISICAACQDGQADSSSFSSRTPLTSDSSKRVPSTDAEDTRQIVRPLRASPAGSVLDSASLAGLSERMIRVIGDGIGEPREARYLDGGRLVVVLDRFAPHLRLFTADGDSLWHGGREGGGPREFQQPQVVYTEGDSVIVFQVGRMSRWILDADTLAFHSEFPLPLNLFPFGAAAGCNEDILLYARNNAHLLGQDQSIGYLYAVERPLGSTPPRLVWAETRDPEAVQSNGHIASILSRYDDRFVMYHRSSHPVAGELLELDCKANILHRYSELSLATGDTVKVLEPRPRAMEWQIGAVAIPGGLVTAQHRYFSRRFYRVPTVRYRTELFLFLGGRYRGSMLIPRQWYLMDFDSSAGVLLTSLSPAPHFVRIPLEVIANSVIVDGT